MYVRTFYNHIPQPPEHIDGVSMAIPDQALTVREIIDRYRLGRIDNLPFEEGEDADIDYDGDEFEDMVDAQDAYLHGSSLSESIQREVPPSDPSAGSPADLPAGSSAD